MKLTPNLTIDTQKLNAFCRKHAIFHLSAFGSVLRDDFNAESDVDLLVEFEPGAEPGLFELAEMEMELSKLFGGREVELRTYYDLSRYFRDKVRDTAKNLYAAA